MPSPNGPEFPAPYRRNNRLLFDEHETENYKRGLLGLPPLQRDPSKPIRFKTAQQFADELALDRRSLGRRIRGREQQLQGAA